jgi:glucoamylase
MILWVATGIAQLAFSQTCEVQEDLRTDCGYVGINQQQCEGKGCCWKPAGSGSVPWCFFKGGASPCDNITFKHTGGPGFTDSFYQKMYDLFYKNLNIQAKGGVVAAPDNSTPGGSYYYHWMRDAGLTMRLFVELNDYNLSKVDAYMKQYTAFVQRTNAENDPYGNDVRINPKFELPNG